VLSGYIIPLSIQGSSPWTFLRRRAERVVPLYWICTTLKLLAAIALPFTKEVASIGFILGSYLMLPVTNAAGEHQPLLVTGWTLVFEAMFYLMVAATLILKQHRTAGILLSVALAIAVVGPNKAMAPLYACFAAGVVLAMLQQHLAKLPTPAAAAVACAGLIGTFVFTPHLPASIACATACIAGCLAMEEAAARYIPNALILLGDASYSLYLTHLLVLMPARMISKRLHFHTAESFILFVSMAIATALLSFFFIERPLMNFFRKRRSQTRTFQMTPAANLAA